MASGVGRGQRLARRLSTILDEFQCRSSSADLRAHVSRLSHLGGVALHCFSFGDHYDPHNVSLGSLLVCNDDYLATRVPATPIIRIKASEIVTWMLSGSLQQSVTRTAIVA